MQSARNNCKHNVTTFRANEHANTKLATKDVHVQSDANPNQANRHWICFSLWLQQFGNTIWSEMEISQRITSLLNFPRRCFKFFPPVSSIFRRVYLRFSQSSSFYISAAVMWKYNISKMSTLHEPVKTKERHSLNVIFPLALRDPRGECRSTPALQKSSSDTRELRFKDT